ncbi:DUF998 domain-containing protein [Gordonia sp. DT30]|uniref:DUF998 domain-containing protein n=1 Tax=Gordonia sp. DT30 TaxID=3416546 RepID=UPI003CE96724
MTTGLLACGPMYALLYILANDAVAASRYGGYSRTDQAISELSATGAPTQRFLQWLVPVFTALMIGFGIGVWRSAGGRVGVRVLGALFVVFGVVGVAWLWFPMSNRDDIAAGAGDSSNDAGHLVLSLLSVMLIAVCTVLAAVLWRSWFRWFTIVAAVVVLVAGAYTSRMVPMIQDGESTVWMGLIERVSIFGFFVWVAVLGLFLIARAPTALPTPSVVGPARS